MKAERRDNNPELAQCGLFGIGGRNRNTIMSCLVTIIGWTEFRSLLNVKMKLLRLDEARVVAGMTAF